MITFSDGIYWLLFFLSNLMLIKFINFDCEMSCDGWRNNTFLLFSLLSFLTLGKRYTRAGV